MTSRRHRATGWATSLALLLAASGASAQTRPGPARARFDLGPVLIHQSCPACSVAGPTVGLAAGADLTWNLGRWRAGLGPQLTEAWRRHHRVESVAVVGVAEVPAGSAILRVIAGPSRYRVYGAEHDGRLSGLAAVAGAGIGVLIRARRPTLRLLVDGRFERAGHLGYFFSGTTIYDPNLPLFHEPRDKYWSQQARIAASITW